MAHTVTPTVNIYYIRGNNVLLGRRANTGYMDGYLCPPGGHIEQGETPPQAIIREIHEELGIEISKSEIEFLCVAARMSSGREIVAYEFITYDTKLVPFNAEPEKCTELVWAPLDELPSDLIPDFREIIQRTILGDEKYLEVGY